MEFLSDPVDVVANKIAAQGFKKIWLMGGGALISAFMRQGLIDDYIISFIPIMLGEGIPLFPPPGREEKLTLVSSKSYPGGLVQVHYKKLPTG